jgi:tRNA (guanine-N7-)-methyltransferase
MQQPLTRSYGRKKARKLRQQSQSAYEKVLPHVLIKPGESFTEYTEVWLEIGFGGGEHLLAQLEENPSIHMVGCEPFMNGVAKLVAHLQKADYSRVKIWQDDVRLLLKDIPDSYFSRTFILFPDPWPKKRHQHRRLITADFINALLPKLKPHALLHIASDDLSYVEQIQVVLSTHPSLSLTSGPEIWTDRPEGWPPTRYEQKALNAGKKCAYMVFEKF